MAIMYVCGPCYEHEPERCGYVDRNELRVLPTGEWVCGGCYSSWEDWLTDDDGERQQLPLWGELPPPPDILGERDRLLAALKTAVDVAGEAQREWDRAPAGMRAGKILIALSGGCPGYRPDTDEIHTTLKSVLPMGEGR